MAIIDSREWPVVKGGEPLALYPLGRGVSVKLTAAQARARGYTPVTPEPEAKKREPVDNKKRSPGMTKKRAPAPTKEAGPAPGAPSEDGER